MLTLVAFALLLMPVPQGDAKQPTAIDGIWFGSLKVGRAGRNRDSPCTSKRQTASLARRWTVWIKAAKGLTVDAIDFKDGKLSLKMQPSWAMTYEAQLNEARTAFVGKFTQGGLPLSLELKKVDKLPEIARPQEPKRPYPYLEEEITYENKKAGITFAGTLTLPKGAGPFPAVLLVTGSGPQDRDETIFNHKPFLIIADYLTRKGIAVLRVDDRGVAKTKGGDVNKATTADFAEDALLGVAYLKSRKEINPAKIGILGHSEGGIVVPLAATQSKDIAFVVMLAGPGLPGEEILYLQGAALLRAAGVTDEKTLARQRAVQEGLFKIAKAEPDDAKARKATLAFFKEQEAKLTEAEKEGAPLASLLAQAQANVVLTPWFRFFLTHDPRVALRTVAVPRAGADRRTGRPGAAQGEPRRNRQGAEAGRQQGLHGARNAEASRCTFSRPRRPGAHCGVCGRLKKTFALRRAL